MTGPLYTTQEEPLQVGGSFCLLSRVAIEGAEWPVSRPVSGGARWKCFLPGFLGNHQGP